MDYAKVKDKLVEWIRDWFENNGKGCNAVLGMSGGKDSTICAALLVEALGKDRVIGVSMPDFGQGFNGADEICKYLGIKYVNLPIGNAVHDIRVEVYLANDRYVSDQTAQNIPPRVRMTMLYALAQTVNGRVCCTDNASENYLGYSTLFGDDVGSFAPLGALTVTEVRAIGDLLGLPKEWVHKTPDDGLPHSTSDEAKFGFTYETLDKYIRGEEVPDEETKAKIDRMHANTEFKRRIIHVPEFNPFYEPEGNTAL